MLSDIENVRKLTELLGDEGFVDALTNAETLVDDVDETLDRVEEIEGEAEEAVREANDALTAVDNRLRKFDEAIRLIEAKIEAGFSVGFFLFAFQQWQAGALFLATGLFVMGLLGSSSLAVTVINLPQLQRLLQMSQYLADRLDDEPTGRGIEVDTAERSGRGVTDRSDPDARPDTDDTAGETGQTVDWQTSDSRADRGRPESRDSRTEPDDGRGGRPGRES